MNVLADALETERGDRPTTANPTGQRRIDVTDLDAAGVAEFVRSNVGTDRVCLEHRGGHTYLLVEE